MVGKLICRLSVETQRALQLLACMGNQTLKGWPYSRWFRAAVGDEQISCMASFLEAIDAGLIFRSEQSYAFFHDRVQEAAYSLVQENVRAETHLRIGRLLVAHTSLEQAGRKGSLT